MAASAAPRRPRHSPCGSGVRRALRPRTYASAEPAGHQSNARFAREGQSFLRAASDFCALTAEATGPGRRAAGRAPDADLTRALAAGGGPRTARRLWSNRVAPGRALNALLLLPCCDQ